jgi:hypothetical protein
VKETRFLNTPSFMSPENSVSFIFEGSNPSAACTFDQSAQLQPCPVSRVISSDDNARNFDAISLISLYYGKTIFCLRNTGERYNLPVFAPQYKLSNRIV